MFRKVMVVINPEAKTQPSLDKALKLARSDDFELVLFACSHTQYLVDGYYFEGVDLVKLREEAVAAQLDILDQVADSLRANGLMVSTSAVWAFPNYDGIVAEAVRLGVDLVIQTVERSGVFERVLLTHDDWQLVRHCPVPLMLVKNRPWGTQPTLLAAVDPKHARHKPTMLDHKILSVCESLSELIGGANYAVHAYHPIPFSGSYPLDVKKAHADSFTALMSEFSVPPDHQLLIEGLPALAIAEAVEQAAADLVVMGAISRSLIADLFIGSTTEQALDQLDCDVLVLKPDTSLETGDTR